MLATAAAILLAPAVALLALVATGALQLVPALLALAAMAAVAAGFALLVRHDLRLLLKALRTAGLGWAMPPGATGPLLPASATLAAAIDRLHRAHAADTDRLTRARDAEAAIVSHLPDPVITLDRGRTVLRANPAARAAFGADLAAVLRQPALAAAVARTLADGQPATADLAVVAPVAREIVATVVAPASLAPDVLAVLSDRTRDRAVERMRADFVANASHELRTPLASLIGFIDTLRGPARDDAEARTRFLDIMATQAARMNRLIDDLLSLSRIELVEHLPPSGTVDLPALLAREAVVLEPMVAARPARLVLDTMAATVPGDADQITQVVHNLIENAAKYGREGGTVRVALRVPAAGRWPAGAGVLLTVSDEGPGIARADLPRLTERFYRTDKARSRTAGGTGLGLAIVKHIVNRHRGQLVIDSTEGVGTTVSVWLPG